MANEDGKAQQELLDLRQGIDTLDEEVLRLLSRRAQLAHRIGEIKQGNLYRPEREAQVLRRIAERNPGPLPEGAVRTIFREIMSACLALEQPLRIAYFGPAGTFTESAAKKHFGSAPTFTSHVAIDDVFRAVESGNADYGVVPVENSTEGVVTHTLDMFVDSDLKIVSQIVLPVQHCLLSNWRHEQIKKLYAHPQSLGQCRGWVQTRLPRVEVIETSSNARSAELAVKTRYSAAIAGLLAAEKYDLPVLDYDIQDNADNATRFLVLGRQSTPPTGNDRTSLMTSVAHKAGALYNALAAFRRYRINMTKIESRPSKRKAWEYFFFIDIDGHVAEKRIAKALALLAEHTNFVKILGSYPNYE